MNVTIVSGIIILMDIISLVLRYFLYVDFHVNYGITIENVSINYVFLLSINSI